MKNNIVLIVLLNIFFDVIIFHKVIERYFRPFTLFDEFATALIAISALIIVVYKWSQQKDKFELADVGLMKRDIAILVSGVSVILIGFIAT